jgi:hypothetical protein
VVHQLKSLRTTALDALRLILTPQAMNVAWDVVLLFPLHDTRKSRVTSYERKHTSLQQGGNYPLWDSLVVVTVPVGQGGSAKQPASLLTFENTQITGQPSSRLRVLLSDSAFTIL